MVVCYSCGTENKIDNVVRNSECEKCNRALKVCKNCIFYDKKAYNMCRESQAERQVDKERPNFCDYFKASSKKMADNDAAQKSMDKLNSLFKN